MNILLIEDEPDIRTIIKELLELDITDCHVICKGNGQEALDYLAHNRCDELALIILDIIMPVMGGIDFLGHLTIKHKDICKDTPILVASASNKSEKLSEDFKLAYVSKPFKLDDFVIKVKETMNCKQNNTLLEDRKDYFWRL